MLAVLEEKPKELNKQKTGSVIFADFVKSSNDNDDLQIRATQGIFTSDRLPEKPEGHSTFALIYEFKDDSVSKVSAKLNHQLKL